MTDLFIKQYAGLDLVDQNRIKNMGDPVDPQDAASKAYVDLQQPGFNEHPQYLLRRDVAMSANKIAGITPVGFENGPTSGWNDLVYATDGLLTYGQKAWHAHDDLLGSGVKWAGFRFDLGSAQTLSHWLADIGLEFGTRPTIYWPQWRVRTSPDGSTWTVLDSGLLETIDWAVPLGIDGGGGRKIWEFTQGHLQETARFWEWALGEEDTSFQSLIVFELEWREAISMNHTHPGLGGGSPNLDGGTPSSTYGGIATLDAGGV